MIFFFEYFYFGSGNMCQYDTNIAFKMNENELSEFNLSSIVWSTFALQNFFLYIFSRL